MKFQGRESFSAEAHHRAPFDHSSLGTKNTFINESEYRAREIRTGLVLSLQRAAREILSTHERVNDPAKVKGLANFFGIMALPLQKSPKSFSVQENQPLNVRLLSGGCPD